VVGVLLFDLGFRLVFALSGGRICVHTIEHVSAVMAVAVVALYLRRRRAL